MTLRTFRAAVFFLVFAWMPALIISTWHWLRMEDEIRRLERVSPESYGLREPEARAQGLGPGNTQKASKPESCDVAGRIRPGIGSANVSEGVTPRRDADLHDSHARANMEAAPSGLARKSGEAPSGGQMALYEVTSYSHGCTLPRSGIEGPPQRAADGTWPVSGRTVAADWRLHPPGSELLIAGRLWRVSDRGRAITGRRVDLFLGSCEEARRWGRRRVSVVSVPAESATFGGMQ